MPKTRALLPVVFLISFSSCVSVLSKVSDDQAWVDYFIENQLSSEHVGRSVASSDKPVPPRAFVQTLRSSLDELPFREFLIQSENREAYQSKLVLAFDRIFLKVKSIGLVPDQTDYASEQRRFLEARSYEKMIALVDGFHRMFLSGVELRASKRAVELAVECESDSGFSSKSPLFRFQPFSGGLSYLPRAVYACINHRWPEEMEQLMAETVERLGIEIKTAAVHSWITRRQIEPIYHKVLTDYFVKKLKNEENRWNEQWSEIESSIDWSRSSQEILSRETPRLRERFSYLNVEARLTTRIESKR